MDYSKKIMIFLNKIGKDEKFKKVGKNFGYFFVLIIMVFLGKYLYNSYYYNYIPEKGKILVNKNDKINTITYAKYKNKDSIITTLATNYYDKDLELLYGYLYVKVPSLKNFTTYFNKDIEDGFKSLEEDMLDRKKNFFYSFNKDNLIVDAYLSSDLDDVVSLYSTKSFKRLNGFTKKETVISVISMGETNNNIIPDKQIFEHFLESIIKVGDSTKYINSSFEVNIDFFISGMLDLLKGAVDDMNLVILALDKIDNITYTFRFNIKLIEHYDEQNVFYSKIGKNICKKIRLKKPDNIKLLECNIETSKDELEGEIIFVNKNKSESNSMDIKDTKSLDTLFSNKDKKKIKDIKIIVKNLPYGGNNLPKIRGIRADYSAISDEFSLSQVDTIDINGLNLPIDTYFYYPDNYGFRYPFFVIGAKMTDPSNCNLDVYSDEELVNKVKSFYSPDSLSSYIEGLKGKKLKEGCYYVEVQ